MENSPAAKASMWSAISRFDLAGFSMPPLRGESNLEGETLQHFLWGGVS
jgi:hypothetical protein